MKEKFSLGSLPVKTPIARIIRIGLGVAASHRRMAENTRDKNCVHDDLERQLYDWIYQQSNRRRNVSGEVIGAQAHNLQARLVQELHGTSASILKFSEAWLSNFKGRWGLKIYRSHGEACDADRDITDKELPSQQNFLAGYDAKNISNTDECGLQYKIAPDRTMATQPLLGREKQKNRITLMVCCNANGSENFELMFVGTAQRPRTIKKKYGYKYGLDYHINSNPWITSNLFFDWLRHFDAYISRTPYCKVVHFDR